MDLSIVIVNYNVKHFLEQCLHSVLKAAQKLNTEVYVVDNNSADGSCSMLLEKFKNVKLIRNTDNAGFSRANNQALRLALGKYVLLLNPDTIVHEESLIECFRFMEDNANAGAVGLKMIDGKGNFLPESKRSLPTPRSAFYKIFGLAQLFPRSRRFNIYHLKHLDKDKIHRVDILTGAFMFIRASALNETGLLDEDFFMYAEDIDLSYRLILSGYKNYYLPEPPIIHFKGESTKKSEFNYPRYFYGSMIRFVKKYYKGGNALFLSAILRLAIFIRALLSLFLMAASRLIILVADIIVLASAYYASVKIWESIKYNETYLYPETLTRIMLPTAVLVCLLAILLWGGYRKEVRFRSVIAGSVSGAIAIIIAYSLLPAELRFSRAIILIWSFITPPLVIAIRSIFTSLRIMTMKGSRNKSAKILIIAGKDEFDKICEIITSERPAATIIGRLSVSDSTELNSLGILSQIDEVIRVNRPDELIFSSKDLSAGTIISLISRPGLSSTEKKIARTDSDFVIGSSTSNKKGEVYTLSRLNKSFSD